ncbi:MAG: hypothetical protein FWC10_02580 [Lentimicrobiaceae bacterium]|nr:hypothetical protein [Lentimicrobiaceae bacterium]
MKNRILILVTTIYALLCNTITAQTPNNETEQSKKTRSVPKHEIGLSIGAFPTIGCFVTPDKGIFPDDPIFSHTEHLKRDNGMYEKMCNFGSYTLNYNYSFNSKHCIGASLSWVGKYIDTYWIYSGDWVHPHPIDTVRGSGWKHYFSLQVNYRQTYYSKNDKISLYWGVYVGVLLCIRDKDILPKETIYVLFGTISNKRYYFAPIMQLNAFGVEFGKKCLFFMELGIGNQGLFKTGIRAKF